MADTILFAKASEGTALSLIDDLAPNRQRQFALPSHG